MYLKRAQWISNFPDIYYKSGMDKLSDQAFRKMTERRERENDNSDEESGSFIEKLQSEIPYYQIDLNQNTDKCMASCIPLLEYMEGYVNPQKNDGIVLAVLSIDDYTSSDDFFMRGFGKNAKYQYRQIEKEG